MSHHCSLKDVTFQGPGDPRELNLPIENSVDAYCGVCADRYPNENLHRIASATGQHEEMVDNWTVKDHLAYQLHGSFQDHFESGRMAAEVEQWRDSLKVRKVKTGQLRTIVRHATREDYEEFLEVVRNREGHKSPSEIEEIAKEDIGYRRASNSKTHLAQVFALTDERGTKLTCWRCDTQMRIGRERLALAVDHILEFGGKLFLRPTGIEVQGSSRPFATKVNRRGRRKPKPPAVSSQFSVRPDLSTSDGEPSSTKAEPPANEVRPSARDGLPVANTNEIP